MFKESKIVINNNKLNGKKILVISDIHYSGKQDNNKLDKLYNTLKKYNPNYICIPGDIIDDVEINDKEYLYEFLKKLGKICTVILSLGNHDLRSGKKIDNYRSYIDKDYINKLNNINNVYLLNNSDKSFKDIYFYGYTQSFNYYYERGFEDKNIMKKELLKYNVCNDNLANFKVLLMHSPVCLVDSELSKMLESYDLILCGHTHNGMIPPILDELIHNNTGLIGPHKKFFPKYARGIIKNKNIVIISSGVTKLSTNSARFLNLFNFLYPIGINVIEFGKTESKKIRYFM